MMSRLLEDRQTSGNDWSKPSRPMLLEPVQEREVTSHPRRQSSIFHDLETQMARAEAEHLSAIDEIQKLYVFSIDFSVREFLREHRSITHLLIQAAPKLREYLGSATVFVLDVRSDEYGWQILYVIAKWPGATFDAMAGLRGFEDEWWIGNSHPAAGTLTFTYELI